MSDFKSALEDFKNGKFLIVTDDANRENEGDLILLAQTATTEQLGFMVRYTSGVICGVTFKLVAAFLKSTGQGPVAPPAEGAQVCA